MDSRRFDALARRFANRESRRSMLAIAFGTIFALPAAPSDGSAATRERSAGHAVGGNRSETRQTGSGTSGRRRHRRGRHDQGPEGQKAKKCSKSTCKKGCCAENRCIKFGAQDASRCGTSGKACSTCGNGNSACTFSCVEGTCAVVEQFCSQGLAFNSETCICSCSPTSCSTGCCAIVDGSHVCHNLGEGDSAKCGASGNQCVTCTQTQQCIAGVCIDAECFQASDCGTSTACVTFSCNQFQCESTFESAGVSCGGAFTCDGAGACICELTCDTGLALNETTCACECTPSSCANGCCNAQGECILTSAQSMSVCGTGGQSCRQCFTDSNVCTQESCSSGSCSSTPIAGVPCGNGGFCDANGVCRVG